jgi:hypothetical protein
MSIDRDADDYESVDDLTHALRRWVSTLDRATQFDTVSVLLTGIGDPSADGANADPTRKFRLSEAPTQDLADLLRIDAAARVGEPPAADEDEALLLRYACARIGVLLDERAGHVLATPPDAVAVLVELARALSAAARIAEYVARQVTGGVRHGSVVPKREQGSGDAASLAAGLDEASEAVRRALGDAVPQLLERLRSRIAELDDRDAVLADVGGDDGSTLTRAAVVECDLGGPGPGRYHARLYTPPGEGERVVILGDLTDHRSTSIVNCVEKLAAIVAERVFHLDIDDVQWVQYIPAGFSGAGGQRAELVTVTTHPPTWKPIPHQQLEDLVGGTVRRWHSRDYTSANLRADGVPVLVIASAG